MRIDDLNTDMYRRAKRAKDIFDGRTPIIFYLTDSKRKVKAPANMWVSLNDVMIKELKHQLGDENVVQINKFFIKSLSKHINSPF